MNKRLILILLFIFTFSLFLRLWNLNRYGFIYQGVYHRSAADVAYSPFMFADAVIYLLRAQNMACGQGFGFPLQPPMYSFFLLTPLLLVNKVVFAKLLNIIFCSLTPCLVYLICLRLGLRLTALLCSLLCATSLASIILSVTLNPEGFYSTLICILLLVLYSINHGVLYRKAALIALIGSMIILTRSEFVLIYLVITVWLLAGSTDLARWKIMLICIAVPVLVIMPWTVRNYLFFKEFNKRIDERLPKLVILSSNGPINFYIGHNPLANGRFNQEVTTETLNLADRKFRRIYYNGYRLGLSWALEHPRWEIKLAMKKIAAFFEGFSLGFFNSNLPLDGKKLEGYRYKGDSMIPQNPVIAYILVPLALIGWIFAILRKNKEVILIGVMIAAAAVVNIAFFGLARSAMAMLPLGFIISCYAMETFYIRLPMIFMKQKTINYLIVVIFLVLLIFDCIITYSPRVVVSSQKQSGLEIIESIPTLSRSLNLTPKASQDLFRGHRHIHQNQIYVWGDPAMPIILGFPPERESQNYGNRHPSCHARPAPSAG